MSNLQLIDLPSKPTKTLAERVILISGATSGLGQAMAFACAEAAATVVLLGRKLPKLNRLYDSLVAKGHDPLLYPLDLEGASPDDYLELAQRLQDELGRLDGILHCAAEFRGLTPLEHTDPAHFARALHINLTAPWWLTQACLPLLKEQNYSAVVFAINQIELVKRAFWGGYGIAQQGVSGLIEMLHSELENSNVHIVGFQPGPMRTALRSKAYTEDEDQEAVEPIRYTKACMQLFSVAGAEYRGQIWNPSL